MCILTNPSAAVRSRPNNTCPAKTLNPNQRQTLAIQALAATASITALAAQLDVSRKFVYRQQAIAQEALTNTFDPNTTDDAVLFYLPVTKRWLHQFTLGLILIGHCSLRGVVELFRDFFDTRVSLGNVHNIVRRAVPIAQTITNQKKLDSVRIGIHDEIFQNGQPVLVGADAASSYCYLMSLEDQRDADTWGIRVLELMDRGFNPDAVVADAGKGLRAGLNAALPDVPCRSDVFHALKEVHDVVRLLENRAYRAMEACDKVRRTIARQARRGQPICPALRTRLCRANRKQIRAIELADDLTLLADWLRHDVLAVAGPPHAERLALFEFIQTELHNRESQAPHHLGKLVRYLRNQRDDLLAFAAELDTQFAALAEPLEISPEVVRELFAVTALPLESSQRWYRDAPLRRFLGEDYFPLTQEVAALRKRTVRASSLIENLNSRLRGYFFLRRQLGNEYLGLLQFFLNHRRFVRSMHGDRVDKSPAELLTGEKHPHWVEMLGFTRFSRN